MSVSNTETKKAKVPYWYKFHMGACPICGKDKSYKERVYGQKPESERERYFYLSDTETYDYCDAL